MEAWKTIEGFPLYEVSNLGNVRQKDERRLLSTHHPDKVSGYCKVTMKNKDGYTTKTVHRLVADAFLHREHGKTHVHHKNRDKTDNRADNLEWVSPKEHKKLDARPLSETRYFINREARKKMSL